MTTVSSHVASFLVVDSENEEHRPVSRLAPLYCECVCVVCCVLDVLWTVCRNPTFYSFFVFCFLFFVFCSVLTVVFLIYIMCAARECVVCCECGICYVDVSLRIFHFCILYF